MIEPKLDEINTAFVTLDKTKKAKKWVYEINGTKNGKRIQLRKGYTSKKEATDELKERKQQISEDIDRYNKKSNMLFEEHLVEFLNYKKGKVRENTLESYSWIINDYVIPNLGNTTLFDLNAEQIDKFYQNLKGIINDNEVIQTKSLSDESVKKAHVLIKDSLNLAVTWGRISKNVTNNVKAPRIEKKKIVVWDEYETKRFLSFIKSKGKSRLNIAFVIALSTGMRQAEILGLPWKNVDFKRKVIYVTQKIDHQGQVIEEILKTSASYRQIAMSNDLVEILKAHKMKINEEKESLGKGYKDNDLVISTSKGTIINPRNLLRQLYSYIVQGNFKKIKFHELRHTFATLMLLNNVNSKIVSEILGHASVQTTLNTYSHLLPNMQKDTAQEFGRFLFGNEEEVGTQQAI